MQYKTIAWEAPKPIPGPGAYTLFSAISSQGDQSLTTFSSASVCKFNPAKSKRFPGIRIFLSYPSHHNIATASINLSEPGRYIGHDDLSKGKKHVSSMRKNTSSAGFGLTQRTAFTVSKSASRTLSTSDKLNRIAWTWNVQSKIGIWILQDVRPAVGL